MYDRKHVYAEENMCMYVEENMCMLGQFKSVNKTKETARSLTCVS